MTDNKNNGFDEMKWQCDNCKRDNVTGREYTYYRKFKCSECRNYNITKIKEDYEKNTKIKHDYISDSSSGDYNYASDSSSSGCLLSPFHMLSSSSSLSDSGECVIS